MRGPSNQSRCFWIHVPIFHYPTRRPGGSLGRSWTRLWTGGKWLLRRTLDLALRNWMTSRMPLSMSRRTRLASYWAASCCGLSSPRMPGSKPGSLSIPERCIRPTRRIFAKVSLSISIYSCHNGCTQTPSWTMRSFNVLHDDFPCRRLECKGGRVVIFLDSRNALHETRGPGVRHETAYVRGRRCFGCDPARHVVCRPSRWSKSTGPRGSTEREILTGPPAAIVGRQ